MIKRKLKPVLLSEGLKEPVVELARITYKSSGTSLYLSKRIGASLHLDKNYNKSLVLVGVDETCMFLMKDTSLATKLKPKILEMRRRALNSLVGNYLE
jgi:hypothetical protein